MNFNTRLRIKTFEFKLFVGTAVASIVFGLIIAVFVFEAKPIGFQWMVLIDVVTISIFLISYRGELEFNFKDEHVNIHWIRKPINRNGRDKKIENKNLFKISISGENFTRFNHSYMMIQIVEKEYNFIFTVILSKMIKKAIDEFVQAYEKLIEKENNRRLAEKKIQMDYFFF